MFATIDMEDTVTLMLDVLKQGGHVHIFCLEPHLGLEYKELRKVKKTVRKSGDEEDAKASTRTMPVLDVEKVALKYTRAPQHYTWNPGLSILLHMNVFESTLLCPRLHVEEKWMLSKAGYSARDGRNSQHPSWTTETSHVGQLPRDESMWRGDGNTRLRYEQKSVETMTTNFRKFTRG